MKFLKWLDKHFYLIMAVLAVVGFIGGMVYAHYACDSLEKQHEAAVAAGVFTIYKAEAAELVVEEDQTEESRPYFDVPLSEDLQNYIFYLCEDNGIDPAIIVAMCFRESTYNANKIGDDGQAFGLMQIHPRWHYERMVSLNCTDLLDPYQNVTVGIDYLCELLNRYDGDMAKALVAYNQGSFKGTVTQYAKDVMEKAGDLTA